MAWLKELLSQEGQPTDSQTVLGLRMYQTKEAMTLMALGAVVGCIAGFAGVVLNLSVHQLEHLRHQLPNPLYQLFFPACGAVLGIFIQQRIFRDMSGHGVPDVIRSVTIGRGILPSRMLFSRLVSSFLTVGSGGAAGLEGPIVVSGAAAGSLVSRLFKMPERHRSLLIACGTSGAIGGIFNAPLTGLVFSLEVILGEWKARNLVPTVTSAAVATQVSRLLMGHKIPFPREPLYHTPYDLVGFGLLGVICAVVGALLLLSLRKAHAVFHRIPLLGSLVAGCGGLGVGLVALAVPEVMGEGYDLIHQFLRNESLLPLYMVFILLFLRILATSLTLGSGGAGGVFAPSLFLGSSLGLLFGSLLQWLGSDLFVQPGAYALGGMAAVVAGIMVAPLTGIFLVLEICGSYDLILPLMLCTLTSFLVSRFFNTGSIYTRDLIFAGLFKPRGSQEQLLADADWQELLDTVPQLPAQMTLGDLFDHPQYAEIGRLFALVDRDQQFVGLVYFHDLKPYLNDQALHTLITLFQLAKNTVPMAETEAPDQLLARLSDPQVQDVAVVRADGTLRGVASKGRVFDFLRNETVVQQDQ